MEAATPLEQEADAGGAAQDKYGGLTKRAYRRRLVKAWERKQSEQAKQIQSEARDTGAFAHFTTPSGRPLAGGQPFQFFFTLGQEMPRAEDGHQNTSGSSDAAVVDQLFYDDVQRGALVQFEPPRQEGGDRRHDEDDHVDTLTAPTSVLPVSRALHSAPVKDVHVKKLQQAELLPYSALEGVDLNQAPANYLTWDPVFGVHKHAPGFERNQSLATEALLTSAAEEIQGTGTNVDVISSGDAVKDIFEAAFTAEPLALRVHRIGPTVFLEAEPKLGKATTVDEARRAALLGKALYRMRQAASDAGGSAVVPATAGSRITSVSSRDLQQQHLHSFSHILRWRLDNLNVLLGLDPPLLRSHDDGLEMMLRVQDEAGPRDVLRDSLSCWFDATLANVPNVGVCIHRQGYVQSFCLQKVQDLLNIVEGKVVTSALSFTRNVLSWIVAQCTNDCVDYVVLRNTATNELELYECEQSQWIANRDAPRDNTGGGSEAPHHHGESANQHGPASAGGGALDWAVANMCFHVGAHILRTQPGKEAQALPLFTRCFSLFATHFIKMEARASMLDIGDLLGDLVIRVINGSQTDEKENNVAEEEGGQLPSQGVDLPNVYREQLVMLQQMLQVALNVVAHERSTSGAFYRVAVTLLHRVAAAVAVCASMALFRFLSLKSELGEFLARSPRSRMSDAGPKLRSLILKNLMQIVTEGLLSLSRAATATVDSPANPLADNSSAPSTSLVDARTFRIDPKFVLDTLFELLGDVAAACMQSDQTVSVVLDVAKRVAAREGGDLSPALRWLLEVSGDVEGLSFSARRFYSKASPSGRVLIKSSFVYYLVGKHYAVTDRNTKALESLTRSKDVFAAAQKCAEDGNPALSKLPIVMVGQLARQALASVYCRMAKARRDVLGSSPVCVAGLDSSEGVVPMTAEEDRLLTQALDEVANEDGDLLLLYCQRMIDHKLALNATSAAIPPPSTDVCDRLSQDVNESWVLHVGSLVKRAVDLAGTSALASLCHMRLVTLAVRLGPACPPQVLTDAVAASVTLPLASIRDVNLLLLQRRTDLQRAIFTSFLAPRLAASSQLVATALTTLQGEQLFPAAEGAEGFVALVSRLLRLASAAWPSVKKIYATFLGNSHNWKELPNSDLVIRGVVSTALRAAEASILAELNN